MENYFTRIFSLFWWHIYISFKLVNIIFSYILRGARREFYVDLISLWGDFVTANPTEQIQNVRAEPIWNNSHLQI